MMSNKTVFNLPVLLAVLVLCFGIAISSVAVSSAQAQNPPGANSEYGPDYNEGDPEQVNACLFGAAPGAIYGYATGGPLASAAYGGVGCVGAWANYE